MRYPRSNRPVVPGGGRVAGDALTGLEVLDRRLRNGARVVVARTPAREPRTGLEPVAMELWVLAGTSAEQLDQHGCAHLLEHMLFKPTRAPRGRTMDIASAIETLGGDVNAFTSHDETVFHATVPVRAFHRGLTALVEPVLRPTFDPAELEREAQVVVEEIRQYHDDPWQRSAQEMITALYGRHSYARPVLADEHEVLSHDVHRLRRFHRRVYAGERLVLVVVGPVSPARTINAARRILEPVSRAKALPREADPVRPRKPRISILRADVRKAQVTLAWQGPPFGARDAAALELATVILGQGESCRLLEETRRRDRLVTDAHASWYSSRAAGTVLLSAHTTMELVEPACDALMAHVRRLASSDVEEHELARGRSVLHSDRIYGSETVQGQAHNLGYHISLTGDVGAERRYHAILDSITTADIRAACRRHCDPKHASIAIVVPQDAVTSSRARALRNRISRRAATVQGARTRRGLKIDRHGIFHGEVAGLRLRACTDPTVDMVGGWLVWTGGQRLERPRDAGAAALMARLLTRGTARRSGELLARELDGMAATLDGFAGRNSAGFHLECLSGDLTTVLRRLLECATDPTFPDTEFREERRVAIEELQAEEDDLAQLVIRNMMDALYGSHPFHRPRRGSEHTLRAMTAERVRRLWRRDYPIGRAVLGLAGDFVVEEVFELLQSIVPSTGAVNGVPRLPGGRPRSRGSRVRCIERLREQTHVALGYPGLPLSDPRVETLEMLMAVLGGQSGRLFAALREEQGLVYQVSASATEGTDAGHITVYASTSRDKLSLSLAALDREIDRIRAHDVGPDELAKARSWLLGQFEAALQRRSRIASHLAFDEAYGLGSAHYLGYARRIDRVSARAIRELAGQLLQPNRRVTSLVGAQLPNADS